ncbi:type II toxin-antitoxin system Phd/YefM family antitoxin [Nostoc sp. CHAB 5784]|uniref:type II toxin-antitoxin system Phd/YefM family antitoxin n=1 Tax=Nostoc mirabile TaxID=2907820 RepID=UPI001E4A05BC|nr:type II toxin-antitoxin system Phd/YefM family antitoxin [Nostoc mirabile]MCC5663140.1 type II toxin-antitoxin system Phd/YefM family antitoxin [Nostoc mirabile CHAB5784]
MSQQYSIEQVPKSLDKIFQEIKQGESVQITQQGQQVAVILPAAEYQRLLHGKPDFWESLERFRQEIMEEGTEIDPDEVWKDVRDKSPGREILL